MNLVSILVFVLIFSFLVIVHELGHFWAAKLAGVRVEEFGLGLPPRIWGKKRGDTIFSFNWIPFGGFVKLKGEGEEDAATDSMPAKSYGWRSLIMIAGVLMNFVTAYLVLCLAMWLGLPPVATDPAKLGIGDGQITADVVVVEVQPGSPAERAGLKQGDVIDQVGGAEINSVTGLQQAVSGKRSVSIQYGRENEPTQVEVATTSVDGRTVIGVAVDQLVSRVKYSPWSVPVIAAIDTKNLLITIAGGVGQFVSGIFTRGEIAQDVTGPIGIAKITAQAVDLGFLSVLQLVIFLSINLGLINLFPFPALDGGRLAFLVAEVVARGRKLPLAVEAVIHNIGFALLLVLIAVVTYRDIVNIIIK